MSGNWWSSALGAGLRTPPAAGPQVSRRHGSSRDDRRPPSSRHKPPSFLEKLAAIERSLSRERGDFEVFGVVLPEESLEQWDLIVAAPWLDSHTLKSYQVVAAALQATFTPDDWLDFSRIVILEKGSPFLEDVLALTSVEHGLYEIMNMTLYLIFIMSFYIITSKRRPARRRGRKRDRSHAK